MERKVMISATELKVSLLVVSSWKAPAAVDATMSGRMGVVPRSIWKTLSRRMPVITEVGQSGPPTKMAHFAKLSPRRCRIMREARISTELTRTSARTET
eukprot:scaffold36362_cov31-Tisochrysis_lutea.AAC.1